MKHKLAAVLSSLLPITLCIAVVAMLAVSFVSFDLVSAKVESLGLSSTHTRGLFTVVAFVRIVRTLRLTALFVFLVALVFQLKRASIAYWIETCLADLLSLAVTLKSDAQAFWRENAAWHAWVCSALVIAAVAIRVAFLFQPMRYDEAFGFLYFVSKPFIVGISFYSFPNNHVLHTALVHLAFLAFGNHPWALRLPALIFGVACVPFSYLAVRQIYNRYAALLVMAIVASSNIMIVFSTNARGYSMVCCFFLMLLWVACQLLCQERISLWLIFVVVAALGFYAIPIMLYPFGVVVAWLFVSALKCQDVDRHRFVLRLLLASAAALVLSATLYLPVIVVSGAKSLVSNKFVASHDLHYVIQELPASILSTWRGWNENMQVVLSLGLLAAFVLGWFFIGQADKFPVPVVLPGMAWIAMALLAQRVVPFERVWLFLLPLYFGMAASVLVYFGRRVSAPLKISPDILFSIMAVALFLNCGALLLANNYVYASNEGRDSEALTEFLNGYLTSGDRVIAQLPNDLPLQYYFAYHGLSDTYLFGDVRCSQRIVVPLSTGQTLGGALDGLDGLGQPELLRRVGGTDVYVLRHSVAIGCADSRPR